MTESFHPANPPSSTNEDVPARFPVISLQTTVLGEIFVWWAENHARDNVDYINNLSSDYIRYKVSLIFIPEGQGAETSSAAIFSRQVYSEALEYAFAIIFASFEAQASICVWMSKYANTPLRDKVKALLYNSVMLDNSQEHLNISRLADLLIGHLFGAPKDQISLSNYVHVHALFTGILKYATEDYTNDSLNDEYNSIKHGNRILSGGFEIRFAPLIDKSESRPDDSEFLTLVKGDTSLHYTRLKRIRKVNRIVELGLEEVASIVSAEQYIQRTKLLCELIDLAINSLRKRCGIINIVYPLPIPIGAIYSAWKPLSFNGIVVQQHNYIFENNRPTRDWGYDLNFRGFDHGDGYNRLSQIAPSYVIPLLYYVTSKTF